jgi:hypothetical protein
MAMRHGFGLLLVMTCLLAASVAMAAPEMGMAVPVPEALAAGTLSVQLSYHGMQMLQGMEAQEQLGLQLGLPYEFEVGVDQRLGGPQDAWRGNNAIRNRDLEYNPDVLGWDSLWFNVKKQLWAETAARPAVAVGVVNLGGQAGANFWGTVGKHFGRLDIDVGWSDAYTNDIPYELVSWRLNKGYTVIGEHTAGGQFSTNFAIEHPLNPDFDVTAGFMRANDTFRDNSVFVKVESNRCLWPSWAR